MKTFGFGILMVSWLSSTDSPPDSEPSAGAETVPRSSGGSMTVCSEKYEFYRECPVYGYRPESWAEQRATTGETAADAKSEYYARA